MAERRSVAPPGPSARGTQPCPPVADLISYALDKAGKEDARRVRTHLEEDRCGYCQGWVDNITRSCDDLGVSAKRSARPAASPVLRGPSPALPEHPPPPLANAQYQQQAFRKLEEQLRLLDK